MKKSALRKDFFMEIRKSMGRFLSIFFIVALGVSLFSGIRATRPDMILSGDAYVDENKMIDIKIVSTHGLAEEDVKAVSELSSVKEAKGTYSVDVLCRTSDNMKVVHVMAYTKDMNLVTVKEGRLPKNEKECLLDQDFLKTSGYKVGDTIIFEPGTEEELIDTLKNTEYKIVGAGNSPLYFSLDRGSSTIGNGSVSAFAVVAENAFALDVYTEIYAMVDGAEQELSFTDEYQNLIDDSIKEIEGIQDARCEARMNEIYGEANEEIQKGRAELLEEKQKAETEIYENEKKLESSEADVKKGREELEKGKTSLASGKRELQVAKQELEQGKTELENGRKKLEDSKKEIQSQRAQFEASKAAFLEQSSPLSEAIKQLQEQKANLEKAFSQNPDNAQLQAELETVSIQLTTAQGTWETYFSNPEKELLAAELLLEQGEQEIANAELKLAESEAKLRAGEQEIAVNEKKISETERILQDTEKQLTDGEKEIQEGREELEKAKQELTVELENAEKELANAEEEVATMEAPEWYVFDRSFIPEYKGYGDNAERIASLATVFPSLFFLVAALISLTTMTRMVEEQRMHIGTLKALGYSKFDIVKKYLFYALLATVGGSLFGVLVGEKIFPYVIIVSYKIMYIHISHVLVPYHWQYGFWATLIAIGCTGGATLFACYKELLAQPAVLMRPEAPKIGKRTLIERISFLWKRLNFSWKSSIRNLFRYKKRFFMTIFGIGGCMGLLMVGYGLRDSITTVGTLQYEELQTYDASVFLGEAIEEEARQELESYLEENKYVKSHINIHMSSTKAQSREGEVDAYLTVLHDAGEAKSYFTYRDRVSQEKYTLNDKGVILSEKTAKMLDVSVGEYMEISEEGKNPQKVKIMAICENYAGHYVYMTSKLYEELYGKEPFYNGIIIKTVPDVSSKAMDDMGERILQYENVLNIKYTKELSSALNDMVKSLNRVMGVLILVAGMLSFVVLYNLNNININERRRELATLKVLGFRDTEVAGYVYRENILLTVIGVLLGCLIGKYLHLFTITTVEVDAAMFGRQIFLPSYLICAFITVVFSAFVSWIMYYKLKKIDMVESLKSVE